MPELKIVLQTIEHVKETISGDDYEFILDAWAFLKKVPDVDIKEILSQIAIYVGLAKFLQGKYEEAVQEMESMSREFIAANDKKVRRQLMDEAWNPQTGTYESRITENMVMREISHTPEYQKMQRGLAKLRYVAKICKALAGALDTLQYSANELSRHERREKE